MKNGLKVNNFVSRLLKGLQDRQKEILVSRYGLDRKPALTLAELGNSYGITRERVRQIESAALLLAQSRLSDSEVSKFTELALTTLRKFGGVRRAELLLKDLGCSQDDRFAVEFLLSVSGKSEFYKEDKGFYSYWYLTSEHREKAASFVVKLKDILRGKKEEVVDQKNFDKFFNQAAKNFGLSKEVAENYLAVSQSFSKNFFGDFGLSEWPEIFPKNARDWAYLVLKKTKKPLHFSHIAEEIRKFRESEKNTNTQTVHNELIKDERFVLVGRGVYGLKEFGILAGTAREVIAHFLSKHGSMKPKELIKLVLQERMFRENTLFLNLQNKKYFKRLENGDYTLRES